MSTPPKSNQANPPKTANTPKNEESLFLLEVLIDKITFVKSPCFSDSSFRTCVHFSFLNVDPLEICDDEQSGGGPAGGPFTKVFNSGKSCLFSLKEADINTAMSKFPIKVTITKSLPCGCLPTKITMGEATIDMTKEFVKTRKTYLENPNSVANQALKDSFNITATDGSKAGQILMFLRISCFGKLIVTKFQGQGGAGLGALGPSEGGVDRSCKSPKEFQTCDDPCRCGGGGRSGGGGGTCNAGGGKGVCPVAQDPYNSRPCETSDDPCYCCGPLPLRPDQMACRNTDQYCLHVPKGALPKLPLFEDLKRDEHYTNVTYENEENPSVLSVNEPELALYFNNIIPSIISINAMPPINTNFETNLESDFSNYSNISIGNTTITPNSVNTNANCVCSDCLKRDDVFHEMRKSGTAYIQLGNYVSTAKNSTKETNNCLKYRRPSNIFEHKPVAVYMTLCSSYNRRYNNSSTQATAYINKCLQIQFDDDNIKERRARYLTPVYCNSTSVTSTTCQEVSSKTMHSNYAPEVYFIGGNTPSSLITSESRYYMNRNCRGTCNKAYVGNAAVQVVSKTPSKGGNIKTQTNEQKTKCGVEGSSAGTNTVKRVSISEGKCPKERPCPAFSSKQDDLTATISHLRIGPKDQSVPCLPNGHACTTGTPNDKTTVKVTTVSNARQGVFELVIRRLNGAPLAKNELMLEWTPPPTKAPQFGLPCIIPGPCPSKCRFALCKDIPCRHKAKKAPCGPPSCFSRCGPRSCYTPCAPSPCYSLCLPRPCTIPCPPSPCDPCKKCCITPPPICKLCGPCKPCCHIPCSSSPCLRPCPVGRKKHRRTRSQPKIIKPRCKHFSPCLNRSKVCPVVRCRSLPGPYCALPCPTRKCCSVVPCKPPPKCCKSVCSTCFQPC